MSEVRSVRLSQDVARRLKRQARIADESASGLASRLIDEGLRSEAHPGIVFRSGPAGRRAALTGGPDVWEVISLLRSLEARGEKAIDAASRWLALPEEKIRLALAYYGDFPEEIDRRLRENERAAERARRAWEAQQQVIG